MVYIRKVAKKLFILAWLSVLAEAEEVLNPEKASVCCCVVFVHQGLSMTWPMRQRSSGLDRNMFLSRSRASALHSVGSSYRPFRIWYCRRGSYSSWKGKRPVK